MNRRALVLILALSFVPSLALAGPFYLGASTGGSSVEQEAAGLTFTADGNGTKYFAGFRTLKFLGFEGTYNRFGSFSDEAGGVKARSDISSYSISVLGVLPVGKHFEVFGRAGYHHWSVDTRLSGGATGSSSDSGNSSTYGVGANMLLLKHLAIRIEHEQFRTAVTDSLKLSTLGLEIRF